MEYSSATLNEEFITIDSRSIHTTFLMAANPRKDHLTAVIMHGAGESNSLRHAGLAQLFVEQGISVISLDFVGHGKTGGELRDNSLALRTSHAKAVIEYWTSASTPLILCGFSMSGHTVLRLLPIFKSRIRSIGLFCPATYAVDAENISFGPQFTRLIRQPDSWRSSLGLADAQLFKGRAIVVIGGEDEVIPWEVVCLITQSLKRRSREMRIEILGGVSHLLAKWLSEHKDFSKSMIAYLAKNEDRFI